MGCQAGFEVCQGLLGFLKDRGEQGFQSSIFGGCQIGRQMKGSQIGQCPGNFRESLLDLVQSRRQHGGRIGGQDTLRMSQQASPIGRVPDPISLQQDQLVSEAELALGKACQEFILFLAGKGRQVVGQRGADLTRGQFRLCGLREVSAQSDALHDPRHLLPKQIGNGGRRHPVLLEERSNHPSLVEGRQGPMRGIGEKQSTLVIRP